MDVRESPEFKRALVRLLQESPHKYHVVVKYFGGVAVKDIAAELGVKKEVIYYRLASGKELFLKYYSLETE